MSIFTQIRQKKRWKKKYVFVKKARRQLASIELNLRNWRQFTFTTKILLLYHTTKKRFFTKMKNAQGKLISATASVTKSREWSHSFLILWAPYDCHKFKGRGKQHNYITTMQNKIDQQKQTRTKRRVAASDSPDHARNKLRNSYW
jgi:hypothetical protein